jgi:hypothetical protein
VTLHLVRHREPPPDAVAAADRVVYERDGAWREAGRPLPDDDLVPLLFQAARVVVW